MIEIVALLALAVLLLYIFGHWLWTSATRMSWSLTPTAFAVSLLATTAIVAWTLTRQPRTWVVCGLLALLVADVFGAAALDPVGPSYNLVYALALSVIALSASYLWGRKHRRQHIPIALVVCGVLATLLLAGCGAFEQVGSAYAGSVFVHSASPQGRWLVIGVQFDAGAAGASGTDTVVARRDVCGVLRQQMVVYDKSDDLPNPQVEWLGPSTLLVNGRVLKLGTS